MSTNARGKVTAAQGNVLLALRAAAEKREVAEAEWRKHVETVSRLLDKADATGIPPSLQAATAKVSRQYLHKRKLAKGGSA